MIKRGATYSLVEQGAYSLGNFLTGLIVARQTDLETFGEYVLMMVVIIILTGFQTALQSIPIKVLTNKSLSQGKMSRYREQKTVNNILASIALIVSFSAALTIVTNDVSIATAAAFGLASSMIIKHEFLRANYQLDHQFGALALTQSSLLVLKVFFVWLGVGMPNYPLLGVFLGVSTAYFVTNLAMLLRLERRRTNNLPLRRNRLLVTILRNWRFGKWLLLETIVFIASAQIYLIVLATLSGNQAAGVLGAIQNLLNSVNVIYIGLSTYILQISRQAFSNGEFTKWKRLLVKTSTLFFVVGILTVLVFSLWGNEILILLYGERYSEFGRMLAFFAIAAAIRGVNIVWSTAYRSVGDSITGAKAKLLSASLAITLSIPIIREFGVLGAAIGLIATQLSWFIVYSIFAKQKLLQWGTT